MSVEMQIEERNRVIGENLRKYRLLKGLTQEELASGLCSVSQLSKVENGKTHLNRALLKQMANRLGVTVERVETADAMREELGEHLQLAKDAIDAKQNEQALGLIESIIEQARDFQYQDVLAQAVLYKSRVLINLFQFEQAIGLVEQVLAEEWPLDDPMRVRYLCELGRAHAINGNAIMAHDAFCRAEEINAETESDAEFRVDLYFNLAKSHFQMQNNRAALRYFEKTERLATKLSKHVMRIRSTYMKATMYKRLGECKKAEELFFTVLKEAEDNSFLLDVAIINHNLGSLFQQTGEASQAKSHFRRAAQVFDLMKEDVYHCATLLHLAEIALAEEEYAAARTYAERVLQLVEHHPVNPFKEQAKAYRLLGWISREEGRKEEAMAHLELSLRLFAEHQAPVEAYELAKEIADELYRLNDPRALDVYRMAIDYNEQARRLMQDQQVPNGNILLS
ncbi:MAG TPA: helix-turn-helix domain-containing protein [Bacilli bacterium]|nr:helix-turn-helix domain-containing protein [Bacilli bacterium]